MFDIGLQVGRRPDAAERYRRQRHGLVDLSQGIAQHHADAYAPRLFAEAMHPVLLASSFSKSFSLYGERAGALSIVA
ncbi:MAG: aminotransferase class I/II-fold pyridoxal phosphate-dependent enzyme, partial [Alphaproteobacteria bacterium]|nr:aminotransferase class I/II-fold pyridoxal phosphate-dependent enzyme [Alphaproteobacteria bacterium]